MKQYSIILAYDEQNGRYAECSNFDGCYTQWDSLEEVLDNMKEIILMCEAEKTNKEFQNQLNINIPQIT